MITDDSEPLLAAPEFVKPSISTLMEPRPESGSTTIISAYFPFEKSKFNTDTYDNWSRLFLGVVETPNIVLYTSPDMVEFFQGLRGDLPPITIRTEFKTVWDIPFLRGWQEEYNGHQYEVDPEREYQSPDLYAVWNVKSWLLNYTACNIEKWGLDDTEIFLWTDVGAFRSEMPIQTWPQKDLVAKIFAKYPNRILFEQLHPFAEQQRNWTRGLSTYPLSWKVPHIAGGFFGGSRESIGRWLTLFTEMHDHFISNKIFIGKDQFLMDVTALSNQEIAMVFPVHQRTDQSCGDSWFMFQPLLCNAGWFASCFSPEIIPIEESFSVHQLE